MNITIIGQDTLAAAITTCCGRHFNIQVVPDDSTEIIWFCYDTPIGKDDAPDVDWVLKSIGERLMELPPGCEPLILVSSQIPVGTMKRMEDSWPEYDFAYSPENIRVASAVTDFENQARIVVGTRNVRHCTLLSELFLKFTNNVIFTDTETAEMVKHALNCYLGLCIAWINEIGRICKVVGADGEMVSKALKTERRISPHAPLKPGGPFGLGHIARDIYVLNKLAKDKGISLPIIESIAKSNSGQ